MKNIRIPKVGDTVIWERKSPYLWKKGVVLQVGLYGIGGANAFAFEGSHLTQDGIASERYTYDNIISIK